MRVLLVPNYSRPDAIEAATTITDWLCDQGVDVSWAPDKKKNVPQTVSLEDCMLVISLGGDGTLLRAAQIVGYSQIPILGISFGHLGFLTTCGSKNYMAYIQAALAGELHMSTRATLDVEVIYEQDCFEPLEHEHYFALNEVALTRGTLGDMVEFDVSVSGITIDRLRGDGFVIATATGSTGYSLSAGGPFVTPEFNGMVCVPIAPHTILARAFLTSPSDVVELTAVPERPVDRCVFVDGQLVGTKGTVAQVVVRRGQGDILLFDEGAMSFYSSVSRVFWGGEKKLHD